MIFPLSKAKVRLVRTIYEKPNIKVSELLKQARISQKAAYKYLKELLDSRIISEILEGKKPTLRLFTPRFSEAGKACFALLEEEKKLDFFDKHKDLKGQFIHFEDEVRSFVDVALIFGSFARGAETKSSDIDLLIVSENREKKKIEKALERCFVTAKQTVSVRRIEQKKIVEMLKRKEEFALQILRDHIVVLNSHNWIEILQQASEI